nr:arylamine N-acetyltransferase [uncultured Halomonas sp.]
MNGINYENYLRQLGFTQSEIEQSITPDLDTLRRLQLSHLMHYPFQSLTTVLGRPVDLEEEVVYDKLVEHREGGYCYELNGLFLSLLRYLGYEAGIVTGSVIVDNNLEVRNPRTHTALMVTIDENTYLVDVGFGGFAPTAPLIFTFDQEEVHIQTTPHGRYKIIKDESVQDCISPEFSHAKVNHGRYILCGEAESKWKMSGFNFQVQHY